MIRKTALKTSYKPVTKINEQRYNIQFDKVDLEDSDLCTFSQINYYETPTTEQMQADVVKYTIERYVNEGLTPPAPQDIDVREYHI